MTTELVKVRNQATCLLFKTIKISSPISEFPLDTRITTTGEIQFCSLDLFLILGIVKITHKGFINLNPLLKNGWTIEQIDSFDSSYFYNFETLVDLCTNFTNGLQLLSAVCGYLKSYGTDYFNKYYGKHIKKINLLNVPPFTKVDKMEVLNITLSFKSEAENLCGITGDLYVIKFSTGMIKVGKSSSGPARIRQHTNEAGRYLVKVVDSYIKFGARLGEDLLLDFCTEHGKLFYGKEYFKELDFNKVKEFLISIR